MLTISPGHYGIETGATGFIDEVKEAQRVVNRVLQLLRVQGALVHHIEDHTSKNQRDNLNYLVRQHNLTERELDVSIHFNASATTTAQGMGTEVLYVNTKLREFAEGVSLAIAAAGNLKNRGAKRREDLAFLNGTKKPAIIIEVCFVNSQVDVDQYTRHFEVICKAIGQALFRFVQPIPQVALSSPALQTRIQQIWADKPAVKRQLQQGVTSGVTMNNG